MRKARITLILGLIMIPAVAAGNMPDLFYGIRSGGMGKTGVADASDPANVIYNPALAAPLEGLWVQGGAGRIASIKGADEDTTIGVWEFGLSYGGQGFNLYGSQAGGAVGLYYAVKDFVLKDPYAPAATNEEEVSSSVFGLMAGGHMLIYDKIDAGAGISMKSYHIEYSYWSEYKNITSFDLGLTLRPHIRRTEGWRMFPTIGICFLDRGAEISDQVPDQRSILYGLSLRVDTPASASLGSKTWSGVPVLALIANLDMQRPNGDADAAITRWGAEAGILKTVFLRYGRVSLGQPDAVESTRGVGLCFSYSRFSGRLDYAKLLKPVDMPYGKSRKFERCGISLLVRI